METKEEVKAAAAPEIKAEPKPEIKSLNPEQMDEIKAYIKRTVDEIKTELKNTVPEKKSLPDSSDKFAEIKSQDEPETLTGHVVRSLGGGR